MNEWMHWRTNERMNGWIKKYKRINRWKNEQTNKWVNEWVSERINKWINEWMSGWMN